MSEVTIEKKQFRDITAEERQELLEMTLNYELRTDTYQLHYWILNGFFRAYWIAKIDNASVGWGTRYGNTVGLYVRPNFRRRGIGTSLLKEITKYSTKDLKGKPVKFKLCVHDDRATGFYKNWVKNHGTRRFKFDREVRDESNAS